MTRKHPLDLLSASLIVTGAALVFGAAAGLLG